MKNRMRNLVIFSMVIVLVCFMAVVLSKSMLLKNNNVYEDPVKDNPISTVPAGYNVGHDDPTPDPPLEYQPTVEFDNIHYWVIGRKYMENSSAKNLPDEITDDLIGEYLGEGAIEGQPGIKVPVYACTVSDGEYLRITYYNGQYLYMQHAAFTDGTILTPRKLAEMLAVNDSSEIVKITVRKQRIPGTTEIEPEIKEIKDSSIISEFWNAFMDAECIDNNEYEDRIYGDMSEEERQELEEKLQELDEQMVSNSYIVTIFFQNGIQYRMMSDEYEGVHYSNFISCTVVMPDEFNYLLN